MIVHIPYCDYLSPQSLVFGYVDQPEKFADILPWHFSRIEDYLSQAEKLSKRSYNRQILCDILQEQNQQYRAGAATFTQIEQLRQPESLVVITGQQVGLFSGPLYTFYKALDVIKLAYTLTERLRRPVVPVFWMAADDHDIEETSHIFILDRLNQIQKLELPIADVDRRLPISQVVFSAEISQLLHQLKAFLPESEFLPAILSRLRESYQSGYSYPQAFGRWLQFVLQPYSLIIVDPADRRLKQLAEPLFHREIEERSPVTRAVFAQNEQLVKLGYPPQLSLHAGTLNLFYHTPHREAIFFDNSKFLVKQNKQNFSDTELLNLLAVEPENFSPNAALRPLYQDTLFPTLVSVLGPAELAYFAQLTKAYSVMEIPMPIPLPRTSVTLVEPSVSRVLRKYDLQIHDFFREKERLVDQVLKREIPVLLDSVLVQKRGEVEKIWKDLQRDLAQFDPNLAKPAEIAVGRSLSQFDFINKKLLQATRQKNETVNTQMKKLLQSLLPMSLPQERIFNVLPFYVRYGQQFVETIFSALDIFNPDHQVIMLGTQPQESVE